MNYIRTHRDVVVRLIRVGEKLFRLDVGPFGEDDIGNPWMALIYESCEGWCWKQTAKCQRFPLDQCNQQSLLESWTKIIENDEL